MTIMVHGIEYCYNGGRIGHLLIGELWSVLITTYSSRHGTWDPVDISRCTSVKLSKKKGCKIPSGEKSNKNSRN